MLGIYIYILLAVPVLIGLSVSLRERHLDRRHFISFVGFTAALAAVAAAATHDGMYMRREYKVPTVLHSGGKCCLRPQVSVHFWP
jgi:hypothetical protein